MRAKDDTFVSAVDLRNELDIPKHVFAETLEIFRHGDQTAVEVFESNNETYLRLGESSRYNCDTKLEELRWRWRRRRD
jgi:hypothetical protein